MKNDNYIFKNSGFLSESYHENIEILIHQIKNCNPYDSKEAERNLKKLYYSTKKNLNESISYSEDLKKYIDILLKENKKMKSYIDSLFSIIEKIKISLDISNEKKNESSKNF